tara:strand:- start:200 stop:913 length:714 start_codon:yes stop_codon:yes gene_type:complete
MALKGKQKNIDANKDGRISAEDFKIMRERQRGGMKKKMGGGLMAATKKLKSQGKMGGGMMVKPLMMNKGDMAKKTFFDGFSKIFKGPSDAYGFSRGKRFATIVGVKPGSEIGKGRKNRRKFKSLEEMRKAKGFKPGETPKQFNQRRMVLGAAKEAAKATRIGKIVLPIALAGVGAIQYLKSKMNKNKPDKKMGGGMMMKPMMRMGGGMMNMPGYKKGKSVMAKGCKLGRKKPTKMYT